MNIEEISIGSRVYHTVINDMGAIVTSFKGCGTVLEVLPKTIKVKFENGIIKNVRPESLTEEAINGETERSA